MNTFSRINQVTHCSYQISSLSIEGNVLIWKRLNWKTFSGNTLNWDLDTFDICKCCTKSSVFTILFEEKVLKHISRISIKIFPDQSLQQSYPRSYIKCSRMKMKKYTQEKYTTRTSNTRYIEFYSLISFWASIISVVW